MRQQPPNRPKPSTGPPLVRPTSSRAKAGPSCRPSLPPWVAFVDGRPHTPRNVQPAGDPAMCKLHTPLPRMGCNYTSEDYVVGPCGLSLVPMSQRGITRCRVGWTSHTESKGDMAPVPSATARDAASALYVPTAGNNVHVDGGDTFYGAGDHAYAAARCTAAHGAPAASTAAHVAPGAANAVTAAPPVAVNARLHWLSGSACNRSRI